MTRGGQTAFGAWQARFAYIAGSSRSTRASESKVISNGARRLYALISTLAAIAMTLCELATANHSPPLECAPHAADGQSPEYLSKASLNTCVELVWTILIAYMRLADCGAPSRRSGRCPGVRNTGLATPDTSEKPVSLVF